MLLILLFINITIGFTLHNRQNVISEVEKSLRFNTGRKEDREREREKARGKKRDNLKSLKDHMEGCELPTIC